MQATQVGAKMTAKENSCAFRNFKSSTSDTNADFIKLIPLSLVIYNSLGNAGDQWLMRVSFCIHSWPLPFPSFDHSSQSTGECKRLSGISVEMDAGRIMEEWNTPAVATQMH